MDYRTAWNEFLDVLSDARNNYPPGTDAYKAIQRVIDVYANVSKKIEPSEGSTQPDEDTGPITAGGSEDDASDPSHYTLFGGDVETMDLIRDRTCSFGFVGYLEGNAIKYLMRWRKKHTGLGRLDDLKKARTYIDLLIEELEGEGE